MRNPMPQSLLPALLVMTLIGLSLQTRGASDALGNFLEATADVIPNKLAFSVSQEVTYDDNVSRAVKGEEQHSWIFSTGLTADWYRTRGGLNYGLQGEISYDHYHPDDYDLSQFNYFLTPHVTGSIGVGLGDLYLTFISTSDLTPLNNADQRYARHYTNGVQAVWNVIDHQRWGLALTGDWMYQYYPESDFKDNTNQKYGLSIAPFYKLSGKTKLGLRLGYEKTNYQNSKRHDDSDSVFLNAFVDYRMTQKFSVYAEAGAEKKSYSGETKGTNGEGEFSPNATISLRYRPVSNFSLALSLYHALENSFAEDQRGTMRETTSTLTAAWTVNPKFLVTQALKHSIQDEKESVLDTVEYEYSLRADYFLRHNLNVYGEYSYDIVHFSYDHDLDYAVNQFVLGLSWSF